jgi:late competence protein required for DNA uptake (superfamily II DNA/RNA helicase)
MEKETFKQIATRVCMEFQEKKRLIGWITIDGKSETEMIWAVINAITDELDRRDKNATSH